MRLTLVLALTAFTAPALAGGDGLVASPDALGPRWQARIEVDTLPNFGLWAGVPLGPTSIVQMTRLLGDYQLDALRFGQTGGLRLTGGLLLNSRLPMAGAEARGAWPYFGIGYAGSGLRGDWGFSADVGLAAQNPGAVSRLGGVFNGRLDLNDALRELRLQPMIRLGVTYSF
ncbi:hypothetical protein [Aquabacterium sp.]|uniref:hypothetical protein n=1 Tax=Aquabacterium sp. TaxID=1872578 RepID=UPI002C7DF9FE|nr:hypothetical protein [Aquabacterium sp.]HSW06114.1 hypothetical protein [Aquabacterium sp.]